MTGPTPATRAEFLAATLARLFAGARSIAIGANSPIPATAALLVEAQRPETVITISGSARHDFYTGGGAEQFDFVAQGRLDAFVLGGAQIDGHGNVNLVAAGDYRRPDTRFPGSFGAAFVYFMIPNVILFSEEHSRRVLVPEVDFISAPGASPPGIYRPGGPTHLLTGKALFAFDRTRPGFRLASVHPGATTDEVAADTGFDFARGDAIPVTPGPSDAELALLRGGIRDTLKTIYPEFARSAFSAAAIGR
jgi:glutaconate CoA-transferase subunit B